MNENLRGEWFMFYVGKSVLDVDYIRIAASCLGDAITTAKGIAGICSLNVIGVTQDLGLQSSPQVYEVNK